MSIEQEVQLLNKLKSEGFDLENCSTAEKVLYVWKLYLTSEDELKGVLEQLETSKRRHAAEVQEIEAYVEQIKALSDEREALTSEFEKENDVMKNEVEKERAEVADMLRQQDLEDVVYSSVPEQVAFLLVERAKLMDALEQEMRLRTEGTANLPVKQDQQTQTTSTQDQTKGRDKNSISEELTNVTDHSEDLSVHSQIESWQEECENCRKLQKDRNQLSTKYIIADEQVKSFERRVARYKALLGEDVVRKEDVIADLQEELKDCKEQLTEKAEELNSTTSELGQVQTILSSLNEKYETYEQSVQPFDSTQTTLNATHASFDLSQSGEQLAQQLQERSGQLESLEKQLEEVKDNSSAELERVILDYEQKLESLGESADSSDLERQIKLLTREKLALEKKLRSTADIQQRVSLLEGEKLEMQSRITSYEQETLTYQNELEQLMANHEEEMDRNEQLQQQFQYATSTIEDLKSQIEGNDVSSDIDELNALKEQYCSLEAQHAELLDKLSTLTTQYGAVMDQRNSMSVECEQSKASYQKVSHDYAALQQVHEILSDEVEQLMGEKEQLSRSNNQLKQQIKAEEEFHTEELADGDQKLSTLTVEFSDLELSNSHLLQEYEDLKATLEELQEESKQWSETEKHVHLLKSQILELEGDNFRLADSVRDLTSQIETQAKETTAALREKEALSAELERTSAELHGKISGSEQGRIKSDKRYNEVIADYDRLNSDHQSLLAEYNDLENKLSVLTKEHKSLDEQYKDMQMDFDMLNEQFQTDQLSNEKTQQKHDELVAECDRLKGEKARSDVLNEQLKREMQLIQEKGEKFDKMDGQSKATQEALEKAMRDLDDTEANVKRQQEIHSKQKTEWELAMEEKTSKSANLTERIILLEKAANQLEGDNKELAGKLQESLNLSVSNGTAYNMELQKLTVSNTELNEQVEKLKTYSESLEKELEILQQKVKVQSAQLQGNSDETEEIAALKSEINRLNSTHTVRVDSLEMRLKQSNSDCMVIKKSYTTKTEELSALQNKLLHVQGLLEEETSKNKQLESKYTLLDSDINQRLSEANERRAEVEKENRRLAAELRVSVGNKNDSLLHETDCNKALGLAESRVSVLENQRDELRLSLQKVTLEVEHANQTIEELSGLKLQLQSKRDEIISMQSKLSEEQVQRSYEDRKLEELRLSLSAANQRESSLQEHSNELKQRLMESESKLSKLQTEKSHVQQELNTVEVKTMSATQKMKDLTAEKETLEVELMAANEKLQLQGQRYEERKTRHRSRLRTARLIHETEMAKLKDKMENLDRDITLLKQSLKEEQETKLEAENKCITLTTAHRNLLSRQVDLEDEIRECNRGIALLQTKLRYTEQDNKRLTELCSRLKFVPGTGVLDTLVTQQAVRGTFAGMKESLTTADS